MITVLNPSFYAARHKVWAANPASNISHRFSISVEKEPSFSYPDQPAIIINWIRAGESSIIVELLLNPNTQLSAIVFNFSFSSMRIYHFNP
jgi:hypothetical protein